jgi:ferritin-like protein
VLIDIGQRAKKLLQYFATRLVNRRQRASQEGHMARYIARFMKDVLGENGHGAEICQRSIEIEASSPRDAAELAKIQFCESENVKDWVLHADRVHVTDAEFPS